MDWNWGSVEAGRVSRALKVKVLSLDLHADDPSGIFVGSSGAEYTCTLEDCTCPDFSINERKGKRQPCKHIIRLGMEMGILNKDGRTHKEQDTFNLQEMEQALAIYAWHYYVLDAPDISDEEYDKLKASYLKLLKP